MEDINLVRHGLDENYLQLFCIHSIHIFYRYIFKTEALIEDEISHLELLYELEINKNWCFYSKILTLQAKSIGAVIHKEQFQEVYSLQNEILSLWKENSTIIANHSNLFVEFAYLYNYQCFIAASVNKHDHSYYKTLLPLLEHVNLNRTNINFIEKYESLHLLMKETIAMEATIPIKPKEIFSPLNQQKK